MLQLFRNLWIITRPRERVQMFILSSSSIFFFLTSFFYISFKEIVYSDPQSCCCPFWETNPQYSPTKKLLHLYSKMMSEYDKKAKVLWKKYLGALGICMPNWDLWDQHLLNLLACLFVFLGTEPAIQNGYSLSLSLPLKEYSSYPSFPQSQYSQYYSSSYNSPYVSANSISPTAIPTSTYSLQESSHNITSQSTEPLSGRFSHAVV